MADNVDLLPETNDVAAIAVIETPEEAVVKPTEDVAPIEEKVESEPTLEEAPVKSPVNDDEEVSNNEVTNEEKPKTPEAAEVKADEVVVVEDGADGADGADAEKKEECSKEDDEEPPAKKVKASSEETAETNQEKDNAEEISTPIIQDLNECEVVDSSSDKAAEDQEVIVDVVDDEPTAA